MVVTTQMCLQAPSRVLNYINALKRVQAKNISFWCAVRASEQELKAHPCTRTRQKTNSHIRMHTLACAHWYNLLDKSTNIQATAHLIAKIQTHIHTHSHTFTHTFKHTDTQTTQPPNTHRHTNTHIHTHTKTP
jgi:hypothetical protein